MIPTITDEQRALLDRDGYFLLENVLTPEETARITSVIEEHCRQHEEALRAAGGGISRAREITFTTHLAENNDALRAFASRPEFIAISTQLLGPDVDLHWNQSVFKEPEGEKEFPWHQDDGYLPVDPAPYLTLWLALNDATPENGCVSVMPGSHKRGLVEHWPGSAGLTCHDSSDPDQGVQVPVKTGSMAVFWSLTMHKSGVNRSRGVRKALILQYSHAPLRNLKTNELFTDKIAVARGGKAV